MTGRRARLGTVRPTKRGWTAWAGRRIQALLRALCLLTGTRNSPAFQSLYPLLSPSGYSSPGWPQTGYKFHHFPCARNSELSAPWHYGGEAGEQGPHSPCVPASSPGSHEMGGEYTPRLIYPDQGNRSLATMSPSQTASGRQGASVRSQLRPGRKA